MIVIQILSWDLAAFGNYIGKEFPEIILDNLGFF